MNKCRNALVNRSQTLPKVIQSQHELVNGVFGPWPTFPGVADPNVEPGLEKHLFLKCKLCSRLLVATFGLLLCLCRCFTKACISRELPSMQVINSSCLTVGSRPGQGNLAASSSLPTQPPSHPPTHREAVSRPLPLKQRLREFKLSSSVVSGQM